MLKKILNIKGVKELSNNQQKSIVGGTMEVPDSVACRCVGYPNTMMLNNCSDCAALCAISQSNWICVG